MNRRELLAAGVAAVAAVAGCVVPAGPALAENEILFGTGIRTKKIKLSSQPKFARCTLLTPFRQSGYAEAICHDWDGSDWVPGKIVSVSDDSGVFAKAVPGDIVTCWMGAVVFHVFRLKHRLSQLERTSHAHQNR